MYDLDRVPGQPARLRRAMAGVGSGFVPYIGAVKDTDLGAFGVTTTGLITGLLQMGQNLTPTYTTVQHWSDLTQSACVLTGGVISDSGLGQIDVSAATGIIKTTASEVGANVFFDYAGETDVDLVNNKLNYVFLEYVDTDNAPTLNTTLDRTTINDTTEILIGWVYRVDDELHILNLGHRFQDHNARNRRRVRDVCGFERATGVVVSTDATRHVLSTEGIVWRYIDHFTVALFDSTVGGGNTFSYWYRDGAGGWTESTGETVIDNLNYDDGTPPLGALGVGRYGVHWVYAGIDGHYHIVYGRNSYKLAEAEDATPPSDIPDLVENMTVLAAKIIVKQNTNTTTVASAFDIKFAATGVDDHNDLGGIQGGAADDYYHLTVARHTDLTDAGDSALHYHATDRARANHTGTQLAATVSDFGEAAQDAVGSILDDGTVGNIVFTYDDAGDVISAVTQDGEIDHDALNNFAANEHYVQTAITNVSSVLATGLLKVTTGTGALSVIADNSTNWDSAFTHASSDGSDHG